MAISDKALKILEFDKILTMLADCAPTEGAAEAILKLKPSSDLYTVKKLIQQTTDAKFLESYKGMPGFGGIKDIHDAADRAAKGATLTPLELLRAAGVFKTARGMSDYINENRKAETSIDEIFDRLVVNKPLEDKIFKIIVAEDIIADDASPALSDIRRKIRNTNSKIKDTLQKYVSGAYGKYLQENIVTMRSGRYVVPVKAECKNDIKGLIHDSSSSGATLFIEPLAVVEANNSLRELEQQEKKEIEKILFMLSGEVAVFSEDLIYNYENITELACIFAKAELSYRMKAAAPLVKEGHFIDLKRARHPMLDKETAVPIDIYIGRDFNTLIVTGPNTGGKTVSIKTAGLLVLMAQAGLHIPADDHSELSVFDHVFADIGDEQSIEQSLSTFSSHMKNIVTILRFTNENSLVLFDELGAGTDPVEGAALAIAILDTVKEKGALCIATTHYAELKAYAVESENVMNASCEFDVETLRPTYRLIIGTPGKSNAFEISKKLGLSHKIIDKASKLIGREDKRFESVIEKLEENRMDMERKRIEAESIKQQYQTYADESERMITSKLEMADKALAKAEEQARQIIESARASSEFVFEQLEKVKKKRESDKLAEALDDARRGIRKQLRQSEDEINPVIEKTAEGYILPRPLKKGDEVKIVNIGKVGVVTEVPDKDGNVMVRAGIINTRTKVSNLMLIENNVSVVGKDKKKKSVAGYINSQSVNLRTFKPEIDLRGMNGEDAWFCVDKYLDDAHMAGIHSVTLIHGKGTGELRKAMWNFLKKDSRVVSYRPGEYGEGDYGVTIVELK